MRSEVIDADLDLEVMVGIVKDLAHMRPNDQADCTYVSLEYVAGEHCYVPNCIVGHALGQMGVDLEALDHMRIPNDKDQLVDVNQLDVMTLMRGFQEGVRHPEDTDTSRDLQWLRYVQDYQDGNATWSDAIVMANDRMDERYGDGWEASDVVPSGHPLENDE